MEVFTEAKAVFEDFIKGDSVDEDKALAMLGELLKLPVTVDVLSKTKISPTLKNLIKCKKSLSICKQAVELQKYWKREVEKIQEQKKRKRDDDGAEPAPKRKKEEAPDKEDPALEVKQEVKIEVKPEPEEVKPIDQEPETRPNVVPTPVTGFKGNTNQVARNTVQVKLWEALGECKLAGGKESTKVAIEIEDQIFKQLGGVNKNYQAKFRSLFSNLKDELNSGLRNALFTGDLTAENIVKMSYEELANPKKQQERKKLLQVTHEARMVGKQEATCDMFTCFKCKKNQTTYFQLQTRSADEPMTTFVTCVNCGNHWRF
eukprot:TRINITY_DN4907_c0_g1_i1.p1 TRINITY_DN4907_c0_g1~~TRINITY_DN4907_c0_g1_i1.p1  ORF type:complete len:317 (+),score=60.73 TRINITY_DN4907_c0_g1_i1:518-1468(+)